MVKKDEYKSSPRLSIRKGKRVCVAWMGGEVREEMGGGRDGRVGGGVCCCF